MYIHIRRWNEQWKDEREIDIIEAVTRYNKSPDKHTHPHLLKLKHIMN